MKRRPKARSGPGLGVAIVDPTTLLGRDVRSILEERGFPASHVALFQSEQAEEGLLTEDDGEAAFVAPLTSNALEDSRIAFLCGRAADTSRFLATRHADGCLAIDLSGLRAGGPFVTPAEDEGGAPLPPGSLYLTYDPTAFVVADALRRLDALTRVAAVTVVVDRPVSELGRAALDEMFQQAISLASFRTVPKDVLKTQAAFNFYYPDDSDAVEERIAEDLLQLFGREIPLTLFTARAGVFHGHHVRIEARFDGEAPPQPAVAKALFSNSAFSDVDPEDLSGPVESAGRDETLVLRLVSSGSTVKIALAADHLRRAGALLGVRLAEQAVRERALLADA